MKNQIALSVSNAELTRLLDQPEGTRFVSAMGHYIDRGEMWLVAEHPSFAPIDDYSEAPYQPRPARAVYTSPDVDIPTTLEDAASAIVELVQALVHTVEYVGTSTLPAQEGWSWYDALAKYAPSAIANMAPTPLPHPCSICEDKS